MKHGAFDTSSVMYVEAKNIDRQKWDKCIATASNEVIYAHSFYLDAMAKHWDALVMNDYEAVMPLTWNKKYGIYYLYQPFLCASLGLFGKNLAPAMLSGFLEKIPAHFKYWDIYLNAGNNFSLHNYALSKRINYTLDMKKDYVSLFRDFRSSYKQLIRKKETNKLSVLQNIDVKEIIPLAKKTFEKKTAKVRESDFLNFERLYHTLALRRRAVNYGVYLGDELLASGVFFFSQQRAYYVLAGNTLKGRQYGASHLVIDAFIKQHAGENLVLDFEGSNVPGIAFFFRGFGARAEEYPGLKYNALPAILRALKK